MATLAAFDFFHLLPVLNFFSDADLIPMLMPIGNGLYSFFYLFFLEGDSFLQPLSHFIECGFRVDSRMQNTPLFLLL